MTNSAAHVVLQEDDHGLQVIGDLNFTTIVALWDESLAIIHALPVLMFDLAKVKTCNSAGLALLIEWIKYAKQQKKVIKFKNIPNNLNAIIQLADVEHLIHA